MTAHRARTALPPAGTPRPTAKQRDEARVLNRPDTSGITVRRFDHNDLERTAFWLVPKLQLLWHDAPQSRIMQYLRAWMQDNQFNFACTDHAVALAQIVHDAFDARPRVEEIFILVDRDHSAHGLALYDHFLAWARLVNATEFRFEYNKHAPNDEIRDHIPGVSKRFMWYKDLTV